MSLKTSAAFLSAATVLGLLGGYALGKTTYPPVEPLLASGKTIVNQDIQYPAGAPTVSAAIVTIKPGTNTGWHHHDAPLFAWVLDGTLTIDYGPDGIKTLKKGDAFLEAFRSRHNGVNKSEGEVRILTVYMGAEGVSNVVADSD